MKKGQIYFIDAGLVKKTRPAIVVSNDVNATTSDYINVVYLTTQPKNDMPEHVIINATGIESTALCENIYTVPRDKFCSACIGTLTDEEMQRVDEAIAISLGIDVDFESEDEQFEEDDGADYQDTIRRLEDELIRVQAERDVFGRMYKDLLKKAMKEA